MQIHERIKKERLKKDLSEEEVAKRLSIKRSTYQYWETTTPSVDKIKAVAKALGFDENYFFITSDENESNNKSKDDENIVIKSSNDEKHGAQISGTVLQGQVVLVEAKDLTASYERLIEEKERTIKIIQSHVEKSEKEKDRLYNFLEKQMASLLNITGQIDTNLKEAKDDLFEIENAQRAQHTVMMHSLERIEGEPGKLHKELSTLEHASQSAEEQTGSVEDVGKRSKE